ncbi:MAG: LamG-like jellyroll fold domain-containing protein, partial [Pseudomonadota bacterium]
TPTDATPIYTLSQKSFSGTPTTINPITLRGDFTIMGTIEFKEDRPIDNRDSLVGDGNYWNGNDLNFYDGKFRLYSSGKKDVVVADTVAEEGGEAHYAIVRKDGITKLFVNGQLEDKATTTWNANFVISEIGGGVQDGGLGGTISDLKIYNEFLTNKEVAAAAEASLGSSAAGGSSGNVQADTGSSDDTADDNSSDDSGGNSSDDSGSNSNSSSSVDLSDAVFTMLGQTEFSGTNSIVSVAPSGDLRVDEATISMFFEADNVSGTKSLLSKDATGYSGGDHLRARIENGELIVRFQNEDGDDIDISAGNVSANKEYHLGITFGDWGARVFLDGELVGFDKEFDMDWLDNIQYLHVGGDGSAQSSGSKTATNPFDGTISDLIIFDDQYGATKLNEIIDAA